MGGVGVRVQVGWLVVCAMFAGVLFVCAIVVCVYWGCLFRVLWLVCCGWCVVCLSLLGGAARCSVFGAWLLGGWLCMAVDGHAWRVSRYDTRFSSHVFGVSCMPGHGFGMLRLCDTCG
jgi:hypothetical protein